MNIDLTPAQREKVEKVLLASFDADSFSHMLRVKLGFKMNEEVNTNKGFKYVASDIIDLAMDGWLDKLLLSANVYREGKSTRLNALIAELNIEPPAKHASETVPVKDEADETRLEKMVRKRAPFVSFAGFSTKLNKLQSQICRIEYPAGSPKGTGWLVGPDLLLTAYHVVKNIDKGVNGLNGKDILCRFDYDGIQTEANTRTSVVADDWLIAKSDYALSDVQQTSTEPAATELDFALIRLNDQPGEDPVENGDKRGWIEVPENAPAMMPDDFVIIPQHPQGRTLELAFGEVLKYNKAANRVQYDTNTEPGSSGSGCFDINLVPFALHHASGPASNLNWNQGVPLREIVKFLKKHNVTPFWK